MTHTYTQSEVESLINDVISYASMIGYATSGAERQVHRKSLINAKAELLESISAQQQTIPPLSSAHAAMADAIDTHLADEKRKPPTRDGESEGLGEAVRVSAVTDCDLLERQNVVNKFYEFADLIERAEPYLRNQSITKWVKDICTDLRDAGRNI